MAIFQALIFLVLGAGLLAVDYRSLAAGWLPCGSRGIGGRLEFKRSEQPLAYWLMFALYGASGTWLVAFSLCLLLGRAEPLPLR